MRKTALQLIDQLPNGTPLECFEGLVTRVHERRAGTNTHGEWSFQNIDLSDGSTKVTVRLKNREAFPPHWSGKHILVTHGINSKTSKPCGIEVQDEDYNQKMYRRIICTYAADIALLDPNEAPPPRQQTQQNQQRQPSQQQQPPQDQQRQTNNRQPQQPTDGLLDAKRTIARISTLYLMCYDAAVNQAHQIYQRHGYAVPPGTVGIMADKLAMESIRRVQIDTLPMSAPPTNVRPLSDLIPIAEQQWDTVLERRTNVEERAKAQAQQPPQQQRPPTQQRPPQTQTQSQTNDLPVDQYGNIEGDDEIPF